MDSTIYYASALARVPVDADVVWRKMKKFDELDWAVGIDEVELVSQSLTLVRWRCQADADADSRAETQAMLDPMAENIVRLFAAQFDAEGGGAGDVSG
jgi:hypothetical protein